jgi:DNA-binding LacI/PurR family transcriptional regulator
MRIARGKIGTLSVQRLCQRMQDFDDNDVKIQVGAELIVRGSTAPPPKR